MKVICAGMPKTGTKSITKALGHLGFTVFDWEEQTFDFLDHWVSVFQNGVKPDVMRVYQNADAAVDISGTFFFEEIVEVFPDCKVILSVREEDPWVKSVVNQIETTYAQRYHKMSLLSPTARKMHYVLDSCIDAAFGSHNPKSTYVFRKRYRAHNHRVKSTVPADKLLVYNVTQGWKPLCDFLGCKVPTIPFPHENVKAEVCYKALEMSRSGRQRKKEMQRGVMVICSALVIAVAAFMAIYYSKR
ncbi:uncharacterized protein LOC144630478 [Oculina patagonica]